jgi:hypothetical protein
MTPLSTIPLLASLLGALFLNGVNIDGVRGQTFEKCRTVRIDERGDIHLDCPGYQVEGAAAPAGAKGAPTASGAAPASQPAAPPAAPATPGVITKRYFLVTEQNEQGAAQYDLDLFINSKWVRKFRAGEDQVVMELTKLLQPGTNKLIFAATKHLEAGRRSASPSTFIRVVVGEGESGGGNVMIDNPLLECKRTAAEIDNVNEEFTIQAR